MSPRRRVVVALAVLLVLALAGVGGLLALRGGVGTGAPDGGVAQDEPGAVLLVPGYGGGVAALETLATVLRSTGRTATVVALPGNATGPIAEQAAVLDAAARAAVDAGAPSVDVIGFSAGGVVARLWVAEQGGDELARRVVTLGSPHHGTEVAALAAAFAPSSCPAACQELAPGSSLLGRLNRGDETPAGPAWVTVWTRDDEVVTPPESGSLEGALDIPVQDVCPGRTVAHGDLPSDPVVQVLILGAVAATAPAVAPCPSP